ncbi:sorting nexin-29 [Macrobrachium rosenbergii]|uniref:sorting nexin-29 n=1 Tax=Macrobrachium rosenbergii TaxID=79674 RepID=UPI0034D7A82F
MSTDIDSDCQGPRREELLSCLLTAVQGCQVRFGGRGELATESDERVALLCTSLESALSHGLKSRSPNRGLAAIKQVTDMVTSGLNLHLTLPRGETETPVLWWYVRELLTRHEYERFLLLKNVNTDLGRGRAWLRSLLNEHSLERYMHILAGDDHLLQQWYESWALLRDFERAAMLPNLAAGLDSILFAINIDNSDLNGITSSEVKQKTEPALAVKPEPEAQIAASASATTEEPGNSAVVRKRELKRRKKKIPSQLISFDDDLSRPDLPDVNSPLYHSAPTTCLSSPAPTTGGTTPYADRLEKLVHLQGLQQAKEVLKLSNENSITVENSALPDEKMGNSNTKLKSQALEDNSTSGLTDLEGAVSIEDKSIKYNDETVNETNLKHLYEQLLPGHSSLSPESDTNNTHDHNALSSVPVPKSRRPSNLYDQESGSYRSSQSNISADSYPSSEGDTGANVFTPIGSERIRGLIPVSPRSLANFEGVPSDDNNSLNSYLQEGDENTVAISQICGTQGRNRGTCTSPISVTSTLPSPSSGDTTLTLDELKSAVLEISRARDAAECRRVEISNALAQEMETTSMLRAEIAHQQGLHQETVERLNGKINVLHRENELLKHQLKKYVGAVQLLRREGSIENVALQPSRNTPDYRDYHDEAAAYERKLIQVAEMHGELMEFNERLHKLLRMREAQVRRLREELIDLRGPLPDEHDDEDEMDDTASVTSDLDTLSVSTTPRTLINIWIPTAFLTGSSSDTHHVYQIYIRIRDDEWNVYRRFAQFYELHKHLKRKDPIVKSFDFPQKKTFGYKDECVVEERRVRLQSYIRKVVNLLLNSHPQLASSPDKPMFTSLLPFFSDLNQPRDGSTSVSASSSRRGVLARLSGGRPDQLPVADSPQYNGL